MYRRNFGFACIALRHPLLISVNPSQICEFTVIHYEFSYSVKLRLIASVQNKTNYVI